MPNARYIHVMKLLTILSLSGKSAKKKTETRSLKQYDERFSTVVTVAFRSQLLGPMDILSKKKLQRKKTDIFNAASRLEALLEDLRSLKNNWDQTLETAVELAKSWGITPKFEKEVMFRSFLTSCRETPDYSLMKSDTRYRCSTAHWTLQLNKLRHDSNHSKKHMNCFIESTQITSQKEHRRTAAFIKEIGQHLPR